MTRPQFIDRHVTRADAFVLGLTLGISLAVIVFTVCAALTTFD